MTQYRLGEIEAKFAALIWDNEPLTSGRLAELCRETLSWKNPLPIPSCDGCARGVLYKTTVEW